MGRNIVVIWMAASLQYLLNTFMAVALEKSLLVIYKILRLLFNTLTADGKHYMLNRNNLAQSIQIQLSEKEKTCSEFFFAFLKSVLNFKHLPKKDDPHSWCISGDTVSEKQGLDKCLKSRVSEDP